MKNSLTNILKQDQQFILELLNEVIDTVDHPHLRLVKAIQRFGEKTSEPLRVSDICDIAGIKSTLRQVTPMSS